MCDFTIIVPVYNEEDNLIRVEKELLAYINMAIKKTAILFVNDGSIDNSLTMIKSICSKNEAFGYISFKTNKGLSAAIKAGFDHVTTDLVGYIDSDLQTSPEDFNKLLGELLLSLRPMTPFFRGKVINILGRKVFTESRY